MRCEESAIFFQILHISPLLDKITQPFQPFQQIAFMSQIPIFEFKYGITSLSFDRISTCRPEDGGYLQI